MILHYSAAGVPTNWMLIGVYSDAYGIAHNAAKTWSDAHASPAFIIQIDEKTSKVARKDLFWPEVEEPHHIKPDDLPILQKGRHRIELEDSEKLLIAQELRDSLCDIGFMVSKAEWRRRRPSDAILSDLYEEYYEAERAAKAKGEEVPFQPRYIMMMEVPDDYVMPYTCIDGKTAPVSDAEALPPELSCIQDQEAVCRLLNTGWNFEETLIHMGPTQID